MQAIQLDEFGPAENLRLTEVPDIHPVRGQVRIAVAAAGVHVIDTTLRSGIARGPTPLPTLPTIPGREVSGTVDEVGDDVDRAWLGRRVVVHLGMAPGGYAAQAVAGVGSLHEVPAGVDAGAAVAMIGTGRTAMAIAEVALFVPSDVVLVTAAAGGIGGMLVQIAKAAGAFVIGLAGGRAKTDQVSWSGADLAIDYNRPDWGAEMRTILEGRSVSVAIDGVGGTSGRTALESVGVGGRLVMIGWAPGNEPTQITTGDIFSRGLTVTAAIGPRLAARPGGLRDLETRALDAVADGTVTPVVRPFALANAAAAHRALESRATIGKVILVP